MIAPNGHKAFCRLLPEITEADNTTLSPLVKSEFKPIADDYHTDTDRINKVLVKLKDMAKHHELCQILLSIPSIGVINATAIYSAIGHGGQFNHAREFAVWLGLTPKQASRGGFFKSSGITKRGNRYLSKPLVHGARAVLYRSKDKTDKVSQWANRLVARRGIQKACVAMAARISRIAWVLLQKNERYQAQ